MERRSQDKKQAKKVRVCLAMVLLVALLSARGYAQPLPTFWSVEPELGLTGPETIVQGETGVFTLYIRNAGETPGEATLIAKIGVLEDGSYNYKWVVLNKTVLVGPNETHIETVEWAPNETTAPGEYKIYYRALYDDSYKWKSYEFLVESGEGGGEQDGAIKVRVTNLPDSVERNSLHPLGLMVLMEKPQEKVRIGAGYTEGGACHDRWAIEIRNARTGTYYVGVPLYTPPGTRDGYNNLTIEACSYHNDAWIVIEKTREKVWIEGERHDIGTIEPNPTDTKDSNPISGRAPARKATIFVSVLSAIKRVLERATFLLKS